jgi:cyclopropane fatty-acyl-phospholipid synthase-like methyltransferase
LIESNPFSQHTLKNQKLTSKSSWAGRKAAEHVTSVPFQEIFHQYLEQSPGKTCLEIGCVPGKFLTYICLNFGYRAEGIDYLEGQCH